jgi:dihydropteroate synthase-like protein
LARYLFVTGKLAADSLAAALEKMAPDFPYDIAVLPISVAALMDTRWISRHLPGSGDAEVVMIPGLCQGDTDPIADRLGIPVVKGPKDLKDIPTAFGRQRNLDGYGEYRARILAEIVDAYKLSTEDILARAAYFRASGADIIDLGCPVRDNFPRVGEVVAALKNAGYTVSLDTFNTADILEADKAGVDMLLSVNGQNLELARGLRCRVVVIPDFDQGLESLERNIARLDAWGVPYIIDPILNPIGFGFAESLQRFYQARKRHPDAEMLMGLGNLVELTDADSTGINAVMAGLIAELDINYVLATEVISWARGAVTELDRARKLMHYAWSHHTLPKHLDDSLLTIKDPPHENYSEAELRAMQAQVHDRNFRIFADDATIYVFNGQLFLKGTDIQALFKQLEVADPGHAFYLGKELQKAALAVKLGKKYMQEQDLRWGYLS